MVSAEPPTDTDVLAVAAVPARGDARTASPQASICGTSSKALLAVDAQEQSPSGTPTPGTPTGNKLLLSYMWSHVFVMLWNVDGQSLHAITGFQAVSSGWLLLWFVSNHLSLYA